MSRSPDMSNTDNKFKNIPLCRGCNISAKYIPVSNAAPVILYIVFFFSFFLLNTLNFLFIFINEDGCL